MYKSLSLMLIMAAITGCQSLTRPADFNSPIVGMRCLILAGKKPFERENLRYIQSYADYGSAWCKAALGKMYQEGGYGVDQDFNKARRLFVESAKLSPSSNVLLGQMAEQGEGEPVNYAKARELYRLSGETGALALGRLMEEGKGAPRDLSGAVNLYLDSTGYVGDDAWKAMDRLRKQGQPLDEMQKQRFQQRWMRGFFRQQHRRLTVREVFEAVNATGTAKNVTLSFRFMSDSGMPELTMIEGSGDANVDRWIMKAASGISMFDSAPLTDGSGELQIKSPLRFSPRDTEGMQSICGAEPCKE